MTAVSVSADTIVKVADYLALVWSLGKGRDGLERITAADFTRANSLALQLQMELPPVLWKEIVNGIKGGTAASYWEAAMALRGNNNANPEDMIWHWAGVGK